MTGSLPSLAVTGATGFVGGSVAHLLSAAGLAQRLLVRDPSRAPELPGASVVACSYGPDAGSALAGVDLLLMVSASESADRLDQHRAFVDCARAAGVSHVVYTSFAGAAPDATFTLARDHHVTEEYLRATGMDFTFLRDNLYIDSLDALVGEDGVIRGPAGDGRVAAVTRADIARTATTVLQDPATHRAATYTLTGPEALTMDEVAQILSRARGAAVTFHNETVPEAYASRRKWEAPDWELDAWVSTYTAIAAGELETVTDDVRAITGEPPQSLAEWLSSNR